MTQEVDTIVPVDDWQAYLDGSDDIDQACQDACHDLFVLETGVVEVFVCESRSVEAQVTLTCRWVEECK